MGGSLGPGGWARNPTQVVGERTVRGGAPTDSESLADSESSADSESPADSEGKSPAWRGLDAAFPSHFVMLCPMR